MSVREIRLFGDPILKSETTPIDNFSQVSRLIQDLLDTTALSGRAGVAATQIGVGLSAFAYNVDGKAGYLINPKITNLEGEEQLMEEGCLSVPGLWQQVPRYERATAAGFQLDGSEIKITGEGLMAQVLQHEIDHLEGLLYLDRLLPEERKLAFKSLREQPWFMR
ncbi:peptide deformylase [bacterium]|nr:peptide deformylase [bacterium]MDA8911223.1 peptide deformylase [bacterium]